VGLGWHIRKLTELFPNIKIVVYEPQRDLYGMFLKYNVLARNQKATVIHEFSRFATLISQEVVHQENSNIPLVLTLPGYVRALPEEGQKFLEKVHSEITRLKVILKTRAATSSAFMDNLCQNAGLVTQIPDVMLLKDRFTPRPAFVVGAGPSLSVNGALLSQVGKKGIIIAASAALKPLLSLGVSPQVVIVIESSDTSRYLKLTPAEQKVLDPNTVLLAACGSHPAHFQVPGFRKGLFHLSGGEAQLLSQGYFLPQGGNAGTAAFALAYVWGLNPLILVGQDQSYWGEQLHAQGTVDSLTENNRADSIMVPAIGGHMVETNTSLLASINWLKEAAALIRQKPKKIHLVNATAQGARIPDFAEIPLQIVINNLPDPPKTWEVHEILGGLPKPSVKELEADLKQMSAIVSQLRTLVRKNLNTAIVEMMRISKVSAFMKQILAPALAGGEKANIFEKLAWADEIILRLLQSILNTPDFE
jgi:hypothetical protein